MSKKITNTTSSFQKKQETSNNQPQSKMKIVGVI